MGNINKKIKRLQFNFKWFFTKLYWNFLKRLFPESDSHYRLLNIILADLDDIEDFKLVNTKEI